MKNLFLDNIVEKFELWYLHDDHSKNINEYKDEINKNHLTSVSDDDFVKFFVKFVNEGGLVQSGGSRSINEFTTTLEKKLLNFRSFVIEPFEKGFVLKNWLKRMNLFPAFGDGIATIYLNRINNKKYPIMNNKTIKGLNKLGYEITSTLNYKNYELVKKYQDDLIRKFPIIDNYFKADALNHYIVAIYKDEVLISKNEQIEEIENILEQENIELQIKDIKDYSNDNELLHEIINLQNNKSEQIYFQGKKYKRLNYLMVKIKMYRGYKCQFCPAIIQKKNGEYYIETCHIKPKAKKGTDTLNNILVLCPNCHKLFDYGNRENEIHTNDTYSVTLNGNKYNASFTNEIANSI